MTPSCPAVIFKCLSDLHGLQKNKIDKMFKVEQKAKNMRLSPTPDNLVRTGLK